MTDARRLCDAECIERMIQLIDSDWTVRSDAPEPSGRHFLHRLRVDTPSGRHKCILKAPEDEREFCKEARLIAILGRKTNLPVPTVLGVVDDHDAVPTPFFVMETLLGESIHKTETDTLSRETLRNIAVSSGRQLASLHEFAPIDAYGTIEVDPGETLTGEPPAGDRAQLMVPVGDESWPAHVERSIKGILDGLFDSQFEDIVPDARTATEPLIADLRADGPFEPVVGRVEHSLDNILVDVPTGELTGMLDWEFVAAMTAANDLVLAEFWLSGGPWDLFPSTPDHRRLVRAGLLEGYHDTGRSHVVEELQSHRDLYELLNSLRTMLLFDGIFDAFDATEEQREEAATTLRTRVADMSNGYSE